MRYRLVDLAIGSIACVLEFVLWLMTCTTLSVDTSGQLIIFLSLAQVLLTPIIMCLTDAVCVQIGISGLFIFLKQCIGAYKFIRVRCCSGAKVAPRTDSAENADADFVGDF